MRNDESLYLAERIRASIASEPGLCELGIEVVVVDDRVVLRGTLGSDRRRQQIVALVRRLAPQLPVVDELAVQVLRAPNAEVV